MIFPRDGPLNSFYEKSATESQNVYTRVPSSYRLAVPLKSRERKGDRLPARSRKMMFIDRHNRILDISAHETSDTVTRALRACTYPSNGRRIASLYVTTSIVTLFISGGDYAHTS